MSRICSSNTFKLLLNHFTSQYALISVCATQPTNSTLAWALRGVAAGYALARSSSGTGVVVQAPASTSNGWTVATSSHNSVAVKGTSGIAGHVCIIVSTSANAPFFVTTCSARSLTTSDTVNIPRFNIRISNPTSS